jgi:hypothetical protein
VKQLDGATKYELDPDVPAPGAVLLDEAANDGAEDGAAD